jgi:hypothetical protein
MATSPGNRIQFLQNSSSLNGIDFVEVPMPGEPVLLVHFLNIVTLSIPGTVTNPQITGGETIPTIGVNPIDDATDWSFDPEGRPILQLTTQAVGRFLLLHAQPHQRQTRPVLQHHRLLIPPQLQYQPGLRHATPTMPAARRQPSAHRISRQGFPQLPSGFAGLLRAALSGMAGACRGRLWHDVPRGFVGHGRRPQLHPGPRGRRSYAADRNPAPVDRAPGPAGGLRTSPATSSTVLLQFNVAPGAVAIAAGTQVTGVTPDGQTVVFETGTGLADTSTYPVNPVWNKSTTAPESIVPYIWDASQLCLETGATAMWVAGHGYGFTVGMALLIDTTARSSCGPAHPRDRAYRHRDRADR